MKQAKWDFTAISCGRDHTLALLDSGAVFGWGGEGSGRIPSGAPEYCASPAARTAASEVRTDVPITSLAAGYGVSLAITQHGKVAIWGANTAGIGGRMGAINPAMPQLLTAVSRVRQVSAGEFQFAALDAEGRLLTWGLNVEGALGRSVDQHNVGPGLVDAIGPLDHVAVGRGHMLAVGTDGRLYGWGSNGAGQLGQGHLVSLDRPHAIAAGWRRFTRVAAGASHSLALSKSGKVYAWGSNHQGQLGRATPAYTSVLVPVRLPEPARAIEAGMHFSVALGDSGTVYTWGWDGHGQLGAAARGDRHRPTAVEYLPPATSIAAGETHVVVLTANGLYGWGSNANGQLGMAERLQRAPVRFF